MRVEKFPTNYRVNRCRVCKCVIGDYEGDTYVDCEIAEGEEAHAMCVDTEIEYGEEREE